jgi:hypothetical protein
MAGFVALTRRGTGGLIAALATWLVPSSPASAQMTNMAPATPAMNASAPMAPGKPGVPPVPEDYFQRYGKILTPGSEPSHPLKLSMPFPDVGQVKVPSDEELAMRDKIERLATMSDDDIRDDLTKWPAFNKMSLADEGAMLMRIQMFKDHRAKVAQERAHALGLLTLKPDQLQRFETEYWDKRLQMDRDLTKQFNPIYKAREAKMEEELFREFSSPGGPVPPPPALAQTPKPAGTPPATAPSQMQMQTH